MCTVMTALSSQVVLIPREMMYFGRNVSRFYRHHHQRKLCSFNNSFMGQYLTTSFFVNTQSLRICRDRQNSVPFCTRSINSHGFPGSLTKQQAKELASKLTTEERDLFLTALNECKSEKDKAGFEGQLAAFRWRSKFGRPSKVPTLGDVDPTGTYCTVPDDWLIRKYVEHVPEPTTKELIFVAISNAIPFIGFGFLDNFIMIVAGDQIEMILSRKFPVSTMAAAALGNTVSDIIGIGSVHYVETFVQKIGFEPPRLTPIQLSLPKTRLAANVGRVCGVTIGCLIGMVPIPLFALLHNTE